MEQGHTKITIDGKEIMAKDGQSIVEAARDHHVYIPTLCDFKSLTPAGTCRICTVKVNGRLASGCTTIVSWGMQVENDTETLNELRKNIIEMLFVEGNHMCPSCEKSGNCQLQALAYRYRMQVPRFPFLFPIRTIEASLPHLILEHSRCIQCLRCVRGVKTKGGQDIFGFIRRGRNIRITVDTSEKDALSEDTARRAMEICPVGALIKKGLAYRVPIGQRKYDHIPIGQDIETAKD